MNSEAGRGVRASNLALGNSQLTICSSQCGPLHRLLLLLGLLLAFGVRLHRLGAESLWYDETVSVYLARLPVTQMLAHTAGDIHPPGYYLLLHGWNAVAQPSLAHGLEFLFGWPSLFFGMIVVAMIYALGRRLLHPQVALLAVFFAALDPFQVWYGQEVRMYTLGAALGLLCLWATLQALAGPRNWRWLLVYVVAGAAGLYVLYYFAFLLLGFSAITLYWIWRGRPANNGRKDVGGSDGEVAQHEPLLNPRFTIRHSRFATLGAWLLAQAAVIILWLPWLPIFWRQAITPPVPPWRTPWVDGAAFAHSMAEALGALVAGQSPPFALTWPWALLAVVLMAVFTLRQWPRAGLVLLLYMAIPLALLIGITLLFTPIYHVRYLSFVAAPFALVTASVIVDLWRWRRWAGGAVAGLLFLLSAASLTEFWTNPRYAADDHRGAVAQLAAAWRPGDAIVANAGWIYPILLIYWPSNSNGLGSGAPPIVNIESIDGYTKPNEYLPSVVRTGIVDGAAQLGWGDPASDFFAVSKPATLTGLANITASHPRLWHYRLYDTVSDPQGVVRTWLAARTDLLAEQPIAGRDYGLVQLFASRDAIVPEPSTGQPDGTIFGNALRLTRFSIPSTQRAGDVLYAKLEWEPLPTLAALPVGLSMSLRLYDAAGNLVAQHDEGALPPTTTWQPSTTQRQTLALPLHIGIAPGPYSLEIVVYRQDNGEPVVVPENARSIYGQRYQLGTVTVHAQRN